MTIESTKTFATEGAVSAAYLAATGVDEDDRIVVLSDEAAALVADEAESDPLGAAWCNATTAGFAP